MGEATETKLAAAGAKEGKTRQHARAEKKNSPTCAGRKQLERLDMPVQKRKARTLVRRKERLTGMQHGENQTMVLNSVPETRG
jgi:hypothetical protein